MNRTLAFLARSGLALALGTAALAARAEEDFRFEVPVQLSKIDPGFAQGKVNCSVRGLGNGAVDNSANVLIGAGETMFNLSGGSYSSTVVVKFNADRPQRHPANARRWLCGLSLISALGAHPLCIVDPVTFQKIGKVPDTLNVDTRNINPCAQGTITPPKR